MDFVSVDVETANADMSSICQVGVAAFKDGAVVAEWESLVDPEDYFDPIHVSIHGIREESVIGQPTLPLIVNDLTSRLDGQIVVSHTHFDRVAIQQALGRYDLPPLNCTWLDSARVARRTWSHCSASGYGLRDVCEFLGHDFRHHDALEDAKAAGLILLASSRETGLAVTDWLGRIKEPIDPNAAGSRALTRRGNPDGALSGEVLVFTGSLSMPRREAADLADSLGCQVANGVTKKTTLLVVGDQDVRRLAGRDKSSKHRKAEDLMAAGQRIRVLRETDFQELVNLLGEVDGS